MASWSSAQLSRSKLSSTDITNWETGGRFNFALIHRPTCQYRGCRSTRASPGSPPPITSVVSLHRSGLQMTFVSHQMLRGRCHSIYCHHDLLVASGRGHGEEHMKKAARGGRGSSWMPTPPTTFIPSLSGRRFLLLVIVWPSAALRARLTAPLSKHGVCAKWRHPSNSSGIKRPFIWERGLLLQKNHLIIIFYYIHILQHAKCWTVMLFLFQMPYTWGRGLNLLHQKAK